LAAALTRSGPASPRATGQSEAIDIDSYPHAHIPRAQLTAPLKETDQLRRPLDDLASASATRHPAGDEQNR
jgi:hypothetical protein